MGRRRSGGDGHWMSQVIAKAEQSKGVSGESFRSGGVFNKTAQLTSDFIAGDRGGSPSQSLKINKPKGKVQVKDALTYASKINQPKKKLTGAKPASAVAGALGSSSGGSVRL